MSVSSRETATGSMSSHRTGSSSQNTLISSASTQQQQQQQRVSHPVPSGISNVDPTALAHHLTLLEASLYMRVRRRQCLEWHHAGKMLAQQDKRGSLGSGTVRSVDTVGSGTGTMRSGTGTMRSGNETGTVRSANGTAKSGVDAATSVAGSTIDVNDLREFCATNDRLAGWVKWTVLSLKNATLRAEAIGTWVRVAEKCRQLDNTSSLCAIVAGLTSSDITRLNVTASLVPTNRSQRLTDLQRITSPAGSFAALKVVYASADGPGVPFVGMYLTGLVHASDQFKDTVPGVAAESGSNRPRGCLEGDEPATPTQVPSTPTPTQVPSTPTQAVSPRPTQTPPTPTQTASIPTQIPLTPTQTTSGPPRTLLNFTKRHKQADIINAMLKFQQWPYTIVPTAAEPPAPRHPSSSPPSTITTPMSPCTHSLYPYTPSTSAPTALYASAVGVAWVEEQLGRAARITLGSDWTYERSMRLFEDEAGWASVKDMMNEVGF
ncbi:hypothetical protein FRC12_014850 [Ceratobasidium sp. 428]|nr:hypothetical protein FRC12_014850 [Ceratobasidium sp. 428]